MRVSWIARAEPLPPCAAVATGETAARLAQRLLDGPPAPLEGVAGPDLLVVLGAADALPWVDGVTYLGRAPDAPDLLLPTHRRPSISARLLAEALRARHPALAPPLAVLPDAGRVLSVAAARPISAGRLAGWLAQAAR